MASLWERAQNLVDDHQDRRTTAETVNQKEETLVQTRDALLAKALEVQSSYKDELAAAEPEGRKNVHANYTARLEGINDAFAVLQQAEPRIATKIDIDDFRRDAERHVERQALRQANEESLNRTGQEQSRGFSAGNGSGFSY